MCFDDALEKENERLDVQRLQANWDARSMQSCSCSAEPAAANFF